MLSNKIMTELKIEWSNHNIGDRYIYIPYEINHDFFLEVLQWWVKKWEIDMENIKIAWPDWWRWWKISWEMLDSFLRDCNYLKESLDLVFNSIDAPKDMWHADDGYYEWFVYIEGGKGNNYIESWTRDVTKEDIYILLTAMILLAEEARDNWMALEFKWD